ncbi:MAG: aromatic amino acid lyase, partial [Candidatus Dormibacteraceae bacterium]
MTELELNGAPLSFADVESVARAGREVTIGAAALDAVLRGRAVVDQLAAGSTPAYGVSTGFGALARRSIPAPLRAQLQRSLIRSHASGMGPTVEPEVVRAMQLLRLRTLCSGMTGVRTVVVERLAELLNAGIVPAVREFGSLGASGDLAPLAHVALVLMGEGEVLDGSGAAVPAAPVLAAAGIEPVELVAKEGLALINGTDGMLGMLVLACLDLERLLKVADITCALSVEALLGTDRAFEPWVAELRPQPGQAASAENLLGLLAGSPIVASHRFGDPRVQDAYSLRCAPQVAGAARDTLEHAK